MRKLSGHKAVTLTELIVASVVITIVSLGATGVMLGMRQITSSSRNSTVLTLESSLVLTHLKRTIIGATGYQSDPGIVLSAPYYSFRLDENASGVSNNSPQNYNDDYWTIYIVGSGADDGKLFYCKQVEATGPTPDATCLVTKTLLTSRLDSITFDWVHDSTDFYVEIDLSMLNNPAQTADPMDNPQFQITTKITPTGHTW